MKKTLGLFIIIFCILSCKKKEGCLDRLARNFDVEAKRSAACFYDGRVVLYNGADGTNTYATAPLEYYFDGQLMLVDSNLQKTGAEPLCDDPIGKTFTIDLGESTARAVNYQIKHYKTKQVLLDSTVTVAGGYCVPHNIRL